MTPSLQKKVTDLIVRLDDCFSINGQALNLRGLIANQKALRDARNRIDLQRMPKDKRAMAALRGGPSSFVVSKK